MSLEQIFKDAQMLPSEQRKLLIHALQETFDAPPDFDEEFAAELERRIEEMDSGVVVGISYEDVMRELRARFK